MRVDIHVEGNDHLILKTLIAKLVERDESQLEVDHIDHPGLGWQAVIATAPKTLERFYGKCCALAVIGIDNDGNRGLPDDGRREDPKRPRHWLHAPSRVEECRFCTLQALTEATRNQLNWIATKPGSSWPIVVCVPVEMIESWILIARAITSPGTGSLHAENESRRNQKHAVYGRPEATREDVLSIALPMLRAMTTPQLQRMREHAKSFDLFAKGVLDVRSQLTVPCWT